MFSWSLKPVADARSSAQQAASERRSEEQAMLQQRAEESGVGEKTWTSDGGRDGRGVFFRRRDTRLKSRFRSRDEMSATFVLIIDEVMWEIVIVDEVISDC